MKKTAIYFDANATSRLRPVALDAMLALAEDGPGNASSVHASGRSARAVVRRSKHAILDLLGTTRTSAKLVFTSGGTEACHLLLDAFLGGLVRVSKYPAHIVVSEIEHAAMLEPIERLRELGWEISKIGCGVDASVCVESFLKAIRPNTVLVSCMAANNETGAIQPVVALAKQLREQGYGGVIVSDMVQAVVKSEMTVSQLFEAGVDAVAISGHKLGAPSGIGAVVFSIANQRCVELTPMFVGGPQEEYLRAGTENLLSISGFGALAGQLLETQRQYRGSLEALRELLWSGLNKRLPELTRITPQSSKAICNTLSFAVSGCRGDDLVVALDLLGVAVSTGAACSSGKQSRSYVIDALELEESLKDSVIRVSLDWDCSQEQIEAALELFVSAIEQMRKVEIESRQLSAAGDKHATA